MNACTRISAALLATSIFAFQHAGSAEAPDRKALFILNSDHVEAMWSAIQIIEDLGGEAAHVFPPNAMIGSLPPESEDRLAATGVVASVHRDPVDAAALSAAHGGGAQFACAAWNASPPAAEMERDAGIVGILRIADELPSLGDDALIAPDFPSLAPTALSASPVQPGYRQTSEFLIGRVTVGIILPESTGAVDPSLYDWDFERETKVIAAIMRGLTWLKENAYAPNSITFVYNIHLRVPIDCEPTSHPNGEERLWIGQALAALGFESNDYLHSARDYVNLLRSANQTEWAFAIFVADGKSFRDSPSGGRSQSAYAYRHGPLQVQAYDNGGWGIDRMDRITAHETGHIFGALDEYAGICGCEELGGYLGIPNSNCEECTATEECIMRDGSSMEAAWPGHQICRSTREALGWKLSDSDGVEAKTNLLGYEVSTRDVPSLVLWDDCDGKWESGIYLNCKIREIRIDLRYDTAFPSIPDLDAFSSGFHGEHSHTGCDTWWEKIEERPDGCVLRAYALYLGNKANGEAVERWVPDELVSFSYRVGWYDPRNTLPAAELSFPSDGDFELITGFARDIAWPSPTRAAPLTINTITAVELRIDNGDWKAAGPQDGQFDFDSESFWFHPLEPLEAGKHLIEIRAWNSVGNHSVVPVYVTAGPVTPGDLDGNGNVDAGDFDYSLFRPSLGRRQGEEEYNPAADFDRDGRVTLSDYRRWYALFTRPAPSR